VATVSWLLGVSIKLKGKKMALKYYWSKPLKKMRTSAVRNSEIHKTSKVESGSQIVNVTMGRHSFCGYDCEIVNCNIGSFCSISSGVVIGGGMHPMGWVSMSPVFYCGRDSVRAKFSQHQRERPAVTEIGHDVWIGRNVLVKQGVSIGTGAVVGMGSVVTKDVDPYAVVAGNPAGFLRKRFSDATITRLLESRWWLFDDDKLIECAALFKSPEDFFTHIKL